jgi:hypothetical protein
MRRDLRFAPTCLMPEAKGQALFRPLPTCVGISASLRLAPRRTSGRAEGRSRTWTIAFAGVNLHANAHEERQVQQTRPLFGGNPDGNRGKLLLGPCRITATAEDFRTKQLALDVYQKTRAIDFDTLFQSPSALFRGAPFWSWNTKLDPDQLCRQIDVMKKMGLGGFHMHSRTGMNTPYLSDAFMAAVKACVEKAEREEMLAWLYDEDRWPSGTAGGLVTKNPECRARHLLFTTVPCKELAGKAGTNIEGAYVGRNGNGHLLARYAIRLETDGALARPKTVVRQYRSRAWGRVP